MKQRIPHCDRPCALVTDWNAAFWQKAAEFKVDHFWPVPGGINPKVALRLYWTEGALLGIFRVEDHSVLARQTEFNSMVCRDSCVEFFVEPCGGVGYCNFEMNACGVKHISHVRDPRRLPKEKGPGFYDWEKWSEEEGRLVKVESSLSGPIPEEREGDVVWTLAFQIPTDVLVDHTGGQLPAPGVVWRGNVYKCGDALRQPHWGAWSPVDVLNFHNPPCFGELEFE